jgi:hypothetical protein
MAVDYNKLIRDQRALAARKLANRSLPEELLRQGGLTTRALAVPTGGAILGAAMGAPFAGIGAIPGAIAGATAASLAEPISNLGTSIYNYFSGANQPNASQVIEQGLTSMGLPQPETATERVVQSASRALTDAATGASAFRRVAEGLPQFTAGKNVAQTLAAEPGAQAASSAIGATVGQGAVEQGMSPALALPLGMLAGTAPYVRPTAIVPPSGGPMRSEQVRMLQERNVPLTPAAETGSPFLSTMESVMKFLPTSATRAVSAEDLQQRGFTRAVFKQAGLDSDIATPEALRQGRTKLGKEYDDLEAQTTFKGDSQTFDDLLRNEQDYVVGFPDTIKPIYKARVDEILKYAAGEKTGDGSTYKRLQSALSEEASRAERSTDPSAGYYGEAMRGLQRILESTMERSAGGPELKDKWRDLNRRYAVFSRIEDAMGTAGQEKLGTGFIPPAQLAAAERRRIGPQQYAEGGSDFTELVRAGASVIPNPVPNSGTAQRSFVQNLLTGARSSAAPTAAGGAVGGVLGFDPVSILAALGGPYATSAGYYGRKIPLPVLGLLSAQAGRGAMEDRR